MGYLVPTIKLSKLQAMTADEVKDSPSVIVTDEEDNYLGCFIVPQTDFIKVQSEYMGQLSNGVKPRKEEALPSQIIERQLAVTHRKPITKSKKKGKKRA